MKRRLTCPVRLVPLATLAVLALAADSRAQQEYCESNLNTCIEACERRLVACQQEPQPPWECEGRYQQERDWCDDGFDICMDQDDPPYNDEDWPPSSPIILDLDGNGIHLTDAARGVPFRLHPSVPLYRLAWPIDGGDAWLALDRNGNGFIDSGAELFGNATALASGRRARHGYEALRELDANGNERIDRADPVFAALRLWRDGNHNGISEGTELVPLSAAGVLSLSVEHRESRRQDRWGNRFKYRAPVRMSAPPHLRFSYDVFIVYQEIGAGH